MEKTKINYFTIAAIGFLFLSFAIFLGWSNIQPVLGSTIQGNDYQATSTAPSNVYGAQNATTQTIKSGQGALGSVIITGASTGVMNFYDATTTNINLRTGQKATSTILIASLPASLVAGTYIFDAEFTDGLTYDVFAAGALATTTITYR